MELHNQIQAILFYTAEPTTVKRLATLLKKTEGEIRDALKVLEEKLSESGLRLLQSGDEVTLGTSPDASALIEAITKEELSRDLSKSALETLSIVLYKGPITRAEIDYIRGVNSTFILRNLLIRGLVEKIDNPADSRSFLYKSTFALLEYMGVTKTEDLPEYHETLSTLAGFVAGKEEEAKEDKQQTTVSNENNTAGEATEESQGMSDREAEADLEADIVEEDEAGENFDDETLVEHREVDEAKQ